MLDPGGSQRKSSSQTISQISHPVLAGAERFGAEHPLAGAQGCVPATRTPGEQLGPRGTCLGPAGGMRPGGAGGRSPGVLGARGPGPHVCTLCLPDAAARPEPGLLLGLSWPCSPGQLSRGSGAQAHPAANRARPGAPPSLWPAHPGAGSWGKSIHVMYKGKVAHRVFEGAPELGREQRWGLSTGVSSVVSLLLCRGAKGACPGWGCGRSGVTGHVAGPPSPPPHAGL